MTKEQIEAIIYKAVLDYGNLVGFKISDAADQIIAGAAITAGGSMKDHAVRFAAWTHGFKDEDEQLKEITLSRLSGHYDNWPERNKSPEFALAEEGAVKKGKVDLIWAMIEEWQNTDNGEYTKSEIEHDLYEWLEKVDPKGRPLTEKPEYEPWDELWDEASEHIDDDLDSLEMVAGSSVIRKQAFNKIQQHYKISRK